MWGHALETELLGTTLAPAMAAAAVDRKAHQALGGPKDDA